VPLFSPPLYTVQFITTLLNGQLASTHMAILTITTDIKVVIVTHRERIIEKGIGNRKHNISFRRV